MAVSRGHHDVVELLDKSLDKELLTKARGSGRSKGGRHPEFVGAAHLLAGSARPESLTTCTGGNPFDR